MKKVFCDFCEKEIVKIDDIPREERHEKRSNIWFKVVVKLVCDDPQSYRDITFDACKACAEKNLEMPRFYNPPLEEIIRCYATP